MNKMKIDINSHAAYLFPMPVVLIGSMLKSKVNFQPVSWISRVNHTPPLFGLVVGRGRHTKLCIDENRVFSINIPDVSLIEKTDYCGLISGGKVDKSEVFNIFYGTLDKAPFIQECPVCISCSVYDVLEMPSGTFYIGEPQEIFTEEKYMAGDNLDIKKINPFTLTMPDNHYWAVGEKIGNAWNMGKALKNR